MMVEVKESERLKKIKELKELIRDEDYLAAAIGRIAQVLSDELCGRKRSGVLHERNR